jgi:ketosteroid isomerase-like protein
VFQFWETAKKMGHSEAVEKFVAVFNNTDVEALASLYSPPQAMNHQVVEQSMGGRDPLGLRGPDLSP